MRYLTPIPKQFVDQSGIPYSDGTVSVYLSGSDELADIFEAADGDALCPNPCRLDSNGAWQCFVPGDVPLDYIVQDKDGNVVFPYYNILPGSGSGSGAVFTVKGTEGEIKVTNRVTASGRREATVGLDSAFKQRVDQVEDDIGDLNEEMRGAEGSIQELNESVDHLDDRVEEAEAQVGEMRESLAGKKDMQEPVVVGNIPANRTVERIFQNANGEIEVDTQDIEFPDYSQRFDNIETEQAVDAKVIASALNDLNARVESVEASQDEKNIGERIADAFDSQKLSEGGIRVKVRQAARSFDGETDKTITSISQDENGVITVTYSAISLSNYEKIANKKTSVTGNESSNTYYPTIKALVDYLDSRLQNLGGKKITNNGAPFTAASQLPTTTPYYGQNINSDDYAYVQDTGLASRYTATVTGSSVAWSLDYEIAIPVFTEEQQAAIDSGVNSTKVGSYDAHLANTSNPHGVTCSQIGASPDTHTHQVVINGEEKTIDRTDGTPVDLGSYITSQDLGGYLTKTGNGSNVTATFTAASQRNNISTGEKLSVIFGKVAKWFSDLKAVAFSGSYDDLTDKPFINDGVLTIKQNGTSKGTFSANQSGNAEINVTDTTYESKGAVSSGTDLSLVTTGEKYTWNEKLSPSGNGSNVTATFTAASSRNNISSGEKLSTIFGKIAKWFTDLKAVAFSGSYSDLSGTPSLGSLASKNSVSNSDMTGTISDEHIASASTWNAKQNAIADLSDIRAGASKGETAVQPGDLGAYMTNLVEGKTIAASLNELNARLGSVEGAQDEKNLGERIADSLDSQSLSVGGVPVKRQQAPKSFNGSTTKTITNLSQDANGEITPTFSDIDFDSKVLSFFPQSLGYMTPDERAALNAKMQEVAYSGGMIVLWDGLGANFPCVLSYYSSSEYYFYRVEKYVNGIEYFESIVTYNSITKTFNVDQSSTTIDPTLYEKVANKKTTITGNETSTTYYPNMKAVVDYINGVMQNLGGKLITDNGSPFSDSADLPSSTPYNGIAIQDKDYAYVQGTGTAERWSATVTGSSVSWVNEYTINIPVFSADQQAAIDSGITSEILSDLQDGVASIPTKTSQLTNNSDFTTNAALTAGLATKQNVISNLSAIESGAAAGATAVQPGDLATVATSGSYSDLLGTPTIPTKTSQLTNNSDFTTNAALNAGLATKQATISDLTTIRSGAAAGATAVQPNDLASVATSGAYSDLLGTPTIPEAATATPQPVSSSAGSTGSSPYFAKGDHVHKIVVGEGVNDGQVSIAGQSVSVKGWATKQDALPVGTTPIDTYAINISGTSSRANNATNDSQGYNIYQKYMRTSAGTKSLSFGSTTTIGSVNGSNVVLSMPQANFIRNDLDVAVAPFPYSVCQFVALEAVPGGGTWHLYKASDVCDSFKTQIGLAFGISTTYYYGMANKAENDANGHSIINKYATKQELSDTVTSLANALHSSVSGIYDSMNKGCVRSAFDYESIAGKFTDVFSVKRESTSYVDAVVRLKVWGKYSYISAINDHTFCADITVQIRGESGSSNWTSAIADGCILYKGSTSSVSDLRVKMTTDSENRLYISILAANATEQYTRMIVESNFMTNNQERVTFSNLVSIYGSIPSGRSSIGAEFSLT